MVVDRDPTLPRSSFAPWRLGVRSSVFGKAGESRICEPGSELAIRDPGPRLQDQLAGRIYRPHRHMSNGIAFEQMKELGKAADYLNQPCREKQRQDEELYHRELGRNRL